MSSSSSSSVVSYSRGIRLRRFAQTRYTAGQDDAFRLVVSAYGAYLMPNEIFRFLRKTQDFTTNEPADEFDGVCSPADLEELTANAPEDGAQPPFFRKATVDLVFRSQREANAAWSALQQEVGVLVTTLNRMDTLEADGDYTAGGPPPTDPPAAP